MSSAGVFCAAFLAGLVWMGVFLLVCAWRGWLP